jgi:hypothetical protein
MSKSPQITRPMSVYLEARMIPKEIVFEVGAIVGTEGPGAVEVPEMKCPDHGQGLLP